MTTTATKGFVSLKNPRQTVLHHLSHREEMIAVLLIDLVREEQNQTVLAKPIA